MGIKNIWKHNQWNVAAIVTGIAFFILEMQYFTGLDPMEHTPSNLFFNALIFAAFVIVIAELDIIRLNYIATKTKLGQSLYKRGYLSSYCNVFIIMYITAAITVLLYIITAITYSEATYAIAQLFDNITWAMIFKSIIDDFILSRKIKRVEKRFCR